MTDTSAAAPPRAVTRRRNSLRLIFGLDGGIGINCVPAIISSRIGTGKYNLVRIFPIMKQFEEISTIFG